MLPFLLPMLLLPFFGTLKLHFVPFINFVGGSRGGGGGWWLLGEEKGVVGSDEGGGGGGSGWGVIR